MGDVAVEIFRDGNFCGERAPVPRHFDIFLAEDDLAAVVGDLCGAFLPLDLVEWRNSLVAENAVEYQAFVGAAMGFDDFELAAANAGLELDHFCFGGSGSELGVNYLSIRCVLPVKTGE